MLLTLLLLGACERTTRDTDIKLVSVAEVRQLIDQRARGKPDLVILIDPRPKKYYEQARLPGARHLTLADVQPRATVDPSISRYDNIIVYGDDPASASARGMTKRLMAVGYRGVRLFAGGMKEWTTRGFATEGTGVPPESNSAEPQEDEAAQHGEQN